MQSPITVNSDVQEQESSLEPAQREQLSKLLTKSNFFRELAPSVQSKLPEIAQCASKPKGTVVFRQGDTGLHCYVVLSGKVGVWIAASNSTKEEEDETEDTSIEAHSFRSANSASSSISTAASDTPCAPSDSSESSSGRLGSKKAIAVVTCRQTTSTVTCSKAVTSTSTNRTGAKLNLEHLHAKQHCETDFGSQVATLGPGSIFGELALLHEQPRNATVTCSDDCELIIIKKNDFNLLKEEVERAKTEKFNFLQAHCPGCKKLSALRTRKIDAVMYAFDKITVPKGHIFLKQDYVGPVGVYLVSSGSVELRSMTKATLTTPMYKPKTCSFGVLLKGAAFGCPLQSMQETFSAVATSACEVYHSTGGSFSRLPKSIQQAIQDNLMETLLWRVQNSSPTVVNLSTSASSMSTPCNSRPSTASRARPSSACSSHPTTPSRDRPMSATPSRTRPWSGQPRTALECDSRAAIPDSGSRPSPTRSGHADTRLQTGEPCSQALDIREQKHRSGIVARTRGMVSENRIPRSSSLPAELKQTTRPQHRRLPRADRNSVLRSASAAAKKEGGHSFNLTMERCKALGGHRLRAVRNSIGASSPSLVDQMNDFKR